MNNRNFKYLDDQMVKKLFEKYYSGEISMETSKMLAVDYDWWHEMRLLLVDLCGDHAMPADGIDWEGTFEKVKRLSDSGIMSSVENYVIAKDLDLIQKKVNGRDRDNESADTNGDKVSLDNLVATRLLLVLSSIGREERDILLRGGCGSMEQKTCVPKGRRSEEFCAKCQAKFIEQYANKITYYAVREWDNSEFNTAWKMVERMKEMTPSILRENGRASK
jgi:hypothetical protein